MKPTALLCSYGFFTYVKPSEPFLTPYLQGPQKNLTEEEVVNAIYPVWIYSYLALLLPVFLLTDYVKYKPVIILQSLGYISCWLLLVFANGVPLMQFMQFCYGIATAGEIGYYSYIYSIVKSEHYQRVTSYVRATTLFGLFFGSLLAQLLVSLAHLDYLYLNVISLANVTIGFFIALLLPMPKRTLFFFNPAELNISQEEEPCVSMKTTVNKSVDEVEENKMVSVQTENTNWRDVLKKLWTDVKVCYTNVVLLRWSAWWALSTCGWLLVVNYIQNLWETIQPSHEGETYNGAVESTATVLGALGAFSIGYIKVNWAKWGEVALGFCSMLKFGLLMLMYWTDHIWTCYIAYVVFIFLYNFVITITQFQLAVGLTTQRFALVFGVNTFAAVALNTVLTIILIDRVGFALDVNSQFVVYSGYFGMISLIFLGHGVYQLCTNKPHNKESSKIVEEPDDTKNKKDDSEAFDMTNM
uniref:Thiamine transporter 1-like n=1 Tax=Phallusia mammillata TaxID=59560 RepID=A0A6F9DT18_9ASCI|nr:thiamine transporter 1-like [Phallusia mammillata]